MDNNQLPDVNQQTSINQQPSLNQQPTVNQPPIEDSKKRGHKKWVIYVILTIVFFGSLFGTYTWQHSKLSKSEQALAKSEQALAGSNAQVKKLTEFKKTYDLPSKKDFSPQCKSSNNSELVVASLTPTPIENYQAYLIACAGDNETPIRVTAFKVKGDGSRSFAYGASTVEPLCISSKINSPSAANAISNQTGVPICKTY